MTKKVVSTVLSAVFICALLATSAFAYNNGKKTAWHQHFDHGQTVALATGSKDGDLNIYWFWLTSPNYATLYTQMYKGTSWTPVTGRCKADADAYPYTPSYTTNVTIGEKLTLRASNSGGGGTIMDGYFLF